MKYHSRTIVTPAFTIYSVDAKMKDNEIRDMIADAFKLCQSSDDGQLLTMDGYGDDPRELWQIPEAINFAKKLVVMGICSVLTLSTTLNPKWSKGPSEGRPFGAFEVWLLAKGELGKVVERDQATKLFDEFYAFLLRESNEVAASVAECRVNDGQHKVEPQY